MAYIFKGRLCGYICAECPEPLSKVKVRLYRAREGRNVTALAVADPKDTFGILSDDAVREKEGLLLAEVETDVEGNFDFRLGEEGNYGGEAFEVDVYCGTVPRQKIGPPPPKPRQFTITTIQPMWRDVQQSVGAAQDEAKQAARQDSVAIWNYCIPERFWCAFRALFGAWVICGRVLLCDTKQPVGGVKVSAFDADWLTDDPLGSATTTSDGRFRIDYSKADFNKTFLSPWINVETPFPPFDSGPDVYFQIEGPGGFALLTEGRAEGHQPGRENASPCLCVELCVNTDVQPPYYNPLFTHVGDFHIYNNIDATTGKTSVAAPVGLPGAHGGPDYGFTGNLKLKGFCPKTEPMSGEPMRYRFLFEHPDTPGTETPITGPGMVQAVLTGSRLIQWDLDGTGAVWTFQSIYIAGSGETPAVTPIPAVPPGTPWGPVPAHVIMPKSDGWVTVDETALDGGFYGPLIRFISSSAVPGGGAPGGGAGNAPADPKNGVAIKLIFEAGPVDGAVTFRNELSKILINNWSEVNQLDLQQFHAPGATPCSGLTNALDIMYTADHELMGSWSLSITSTASSLPGGWAPTPPPPPLPSGSTPRGGNGTYPRDITGWPACSYTVTLTTHRKLTDGETEVSAWPNPLTFCK